MVVRMESWRQGVGRQLVESLQDVAASLGHPRTWVATGTVNQARMTAASCLIGRAEGTGLLVKKPPPRLADRVGSVEDLFGHAATP